MLISCFIRTRRKNSLAFAIIIAFCVVSSLDLFRLTQIQGIPAHIPPIVNFIWFGIRVAIYSIFYGGFVHFGKKYLVFLKKNQILATDNK